MVILTGDVVAIKESYENGYAALFGQAIQAIKTRKIPYAWTGGNPVPGYSNYDLHEIDYTTGGEYSWTGYVWDIGHEDMPYTHEELGYFTSRIPIMDPQGSGEVLSIYSLDSSDKSCIDHSLPGNTCVPLAAVEWLGLQQSSYSHQYDQRDFIFMHWPIQEFMNFSNLYHFRGSKHQVIGCQSLNSGVFAQSKEFNRTAWISAGGDHDNDFVGKYHDLYFSYARKTGYGGDGKLHRGARVFELSWKKGIGMRGNSYIIEGRTGHHAEMEIQYPPTFAFLLQTQCSRDIIQEMFD